jgi:hypothetical protein
MPRGYDPDRTDVLDGAVIRDDDPDRTVVLGGAVAKGDDPDRTVVLNDAVGPSRTGRLSTASGRSP